MKKYNQYIDDILNNKIIHNRQIKQAVNRHLKDLENVKDGAYVFSEVEADKAIAFIESLKLFEGDKAGQFFILEDFQAFFIALLFGWRKKKNNRRRFKKAFDFIGKGNGKSPLMAAIGLLILGESDGGQVYSIATDGSQSKIIFNWMKGFIQYSTKLSEKINVFYRSIYYPKKLSTFRPLSKNVTNVDGFNPSCIIADEVAAMRGDELFNSVSASLFKREDSLLLMITHGNYYQESAGYIQYQYACKVLDGDVEDDEYLAIIYELDVADDWKDEKNIRKANPASFVDVDAIAKRIEYAKNVPSEEREVRVKNLNQWLLGQAASWIRPQLWDKAISNYKKYKDYLTEEKLKTYPCAMGLDLSKRDDFTTYTIAFYIAELDKFYLKHRYYIPRCEIPEKCKTNSTLIWKWVEDGWITATDLARIDNDTLVSDILVDYDNYKPIQLNYDPALSGELEASIKSRVSMMPIQQGGWLSEPNKDFEEYAIYEKIIDANPVMKWNVCNAVASYKGDGKLLIVGKEHKDSPKKIDGVSASVMALMPLKAMMMPKLPEPTYSFDIQFI